MPSVTTFQIDPGHQFHRRPPVKARYGFSDSTLYRWMAEGQFPKPVRLGLNLVAWRESELREYDADPLGWTEKPPSDQGSVK